MKNGGYYKSQMMSMKFRELADDYQRKILKLNLKHQAQITEIKTRNKVATVEDKAKSIIDRLMTNPELMNEFNLQMRTHKLEQIKKHKK